MSEERVVVNGSLLTDATCAYTAAFEDFALASNVYASLMVRYTAQFWQVMRRRYEGRPIRVLDVGCNNGAALKLYTSPTMQTQKRKPIEYVGVDLSEVVLTANAPPAKCVVDAVFHHADITDPWVWAEDDFFDVVWYTEVIEHVPPTKALFTLEECYRVTAAGGTLFLATPAPFDDKLVWPDSHDHEFTREETLKMLETSGWRLLDTWGVNTNWVQGGARLRRLHPEGAKLLDTLSRRMSPSFAHVVTQALYPDVCDDLAFFAIKDGPCDTCDALSIKATDKYNLRRHWKAAHG